MLRHTRDRWLLAIACLLWATTATADEAVKPTLPKPAEKKIDFAVDIEPIFAKACYSCHGPDKQKSSFRLDRKADAMKGGDNGEAILPGKSAESPLVKYVAGLDEDMLMPPKGERLTAEQVGLLRAWIDQGAVWPETTVAKTEKWWSLKAPVKVEPPKLTPEEAARARNPIDAFIMEKLRDKGLKPSPEADRRTLIRRLYYDLIGLPPDPKAVEAYIHDQDARAYERVVDELLASKRYGERWGRHWLDVVHYGDTHGYDKDQPRPTAWPYRDYVIRAFNEDRPYGQFVQEQLAGDMLFPNTRDGVEALGFISAGPWDFIGHVEVPETKIDGKIARSLDRDDMVSNTMNTFDSMTVQCARCHNHKFDPVTQDDYYSLQAVFAAVDRAPKMYDVSPAVAADRVRLVARRDQLAAQQKSLQEVTAKKAGPRLAELDKQISLLEKPKPGDPSKTAAYGYHSGISPSPGAVKWVQVDLGQPIALAKISLHACSDDFAGIGEGFGFPTRFKVELSNDAEFKSGVTVLADQTAADFANPKLTPVVYPLSGQTGRYVRVTATKLTHRMSDYICAISELGVYDAQMTNVAAGKSVTALDSIEAPVRWAKANLVDRYYPGASPTGSPDELAKIKAERDKLYDAAIDADTRQQLSATSAELAATVAQLAKLPAQQVVFAGTVHKGEGAFRGTGNEGGKPREIHVLRRGDVRDERQIVGPGVPPVLEGAPSRFELPADAPEGQRRVALARWITDPRNPLTWRTIVNRVWLYHFGHAIVDSPNDFGRMGQLPSHPELLDWLAVEFRDGGQSIKSLQRMICTSATYRQSSAIDPRQAVVDSGNVYLWRMSRRRLEAEAIRDAVLLVSGKLNESMGGPGFQDFKVEHPEHSPHYEYKLHDPEDPLSHRRSVYRFIVRSQPQPFMTTLDCADPSMSVDKRNESMTSLQALALLNNKLMIAMAKHFAERLQKESPDPATEIDTAYRLALGRAATAEERETLVKYAQQFGMANACRVIFNLNEFVFVD